MYRIEVAPAAEREIMKLRARIKINDFDRIRDAITNLTQEPRPQGVRKMKGAEKAYRIRVGRYRVIYEVYDSDNLVLILLVTRRSETTYR